MKKFLVYANCQSQALALTLMENKEFESVYERIYVPQVQYLGKKDIEDLLYKVSSVDLFIYQPVSNIQSRPVELSSDFLLQKTKKSAELISFPSIYFDGYFPHLQTLYGYVSQLNLVHDYFVAYLCSSGFSTEQAIEIIQSEDLYPKTISKELVEKSLLTLKKREEQFSVDIKVSSYISENYGTSKLFNQFNHPKRPVFKYVSESIMKKIGIQDFRIQEEGISHLDGIVTPIYKSTYKNLELNFNENFETYTAGKHGVQNQKSVIKGFYEFYKTKNLKQINDHICKEKPFIPKIIESMNLT